MFKQAFNFVQPVNVESLVVRRKGKIIKGETQAAIVQAITERKRLKNALRRERQARSPK